VLISGEPGIGKSRISALYWNGSGRTTLQLRYFCSRTIATARSIRSPPNSSTPRIYPRRWTGGKARKLARYYIESGDSAFRDSVCVRRSGITDRNPPPTIRGKA
jgi:hypothetical protein